MEKLIRDGVALAYETRGQGDPPILLVHGWTCDHTYFAPQAEHFSRSHRVVSVDLRAQRHDRSLPSNLGFRRRLKVPPTINRRRHER